MIRRNEAWVLCLNEKGVTDRIVDFLSYLGAIKSIKSKIEGTPDYMTWIRGPRSVIKHFIKRRGFKMGRDEEGNYWEYRGTEEWIWGKA